MVLVVEEEIVVVKKPESLGFEYVSFEEEDQLKADGRLTGLLQPIVGP